MGRECVTARAVLAGERARMDGRGSANILEFGRFRFDRRGRYLFRLDPAGKAVLVPLGQTALDVLDVLLGRQGEVVEREDFKKTVWRGKTVEDANLAVQISNLRDSLGRSRIQTISGRGYRFIGPVTPVVATAPLVNSRPTCFTSTARPL
jgi:DNA-binding winged helix-turn-helix (wHTH) protein